MLILPPPNHSACGGSHFSTVSHDLNQCSSSAMRAQKDSGSASASARSLSSSSIDLICARCEKPSGGGKSRSSWSTDSMLVGTVDMLPVYHRQLPIANCRLPISGSGLVLYCFHKLAIGN